MTGPSVPARFAERMRAARKESGMTVQALAAKVGVTGFTLYRAEGRHGGLNLTTAVAVARALPEMGGLDWLLDEDG